MRLPVAGGAPAEVVVEERPDTSGSSSTALPSSNASRSTAKASAGCTFPGLLSGVTWHFFQNRVPRPTERAAQYIFDVSAVWELSYHLLYGQKTILANWASNFCPRILTKNLSCG